MFGYRIEPDFDLAREHRQDRATWAGIGGTVVAGVYFLWQGPFALQVFQGFVATLLCYGFGFYVRRRSDLAKLWLWKVILATIPLHVLYLVGIFWSDKIIPSLMTKALGFMPVLAVGFVIESLLFDRIVDRFKPPSADRASGSIAQT